MAHSVFKISKKSSANIKLYKEVKDAKNYTMKKTVFTKFCHLVKFVKYGIRKHLKTRDGIYRL